MCLIPVKYSRRSTVFRRLRDNGNWEWVGKQSGHLGEEESKKKRCDLKNKSENNEILGEMSEKGIKTNKKTDKVAKEAVYYWLVGFICLKMYEERNLESNFPLFGQSNCKLRFYSHKKIHFNLYPPEFFFFFFADCLYLVFWPPKCELLLACVHVTFSTPFLSETMHIF